MNVKSGKELNFLLQHGDKLVYFLKLVKKSLGEELYKNLYPQGLQPGVLYSLSKIHKPFVNIILKLRPILSALNTGTYKWAKFFVSLLRDLTSNEYSLKDSFEFAKAICEQNSDLYMASLDVDLLFTNVSLYETIGICTQGLFESDSTVYCLNKIEVFEMLSLTTKESIILFDMEFYSQIGGMAVGSPLGPTLANLLLCHHEKKLLNDCPNSFKPVFYKRYIDDIFVLLKKSEHVQLFVNYMNSKHKNISFSYETEKDGAMPFLDVNISRENGKFVTNVYRKETFTGVYTNFSSFIPLEYKFGLAYTLLHRYFDLLSDMSKFHLEVAKLKEILLKNGYSWKIIDACVFKFLNKFFEPKPVTLTVPKKQLFIVLPFMSNMSGVIKTGLSKA